jgi:hypothetical protein
LIDSLFVLFVFVSEVASLIKGQPLEKIKDILAKGTKHEGKSETNNNEKKEEKKSL